MCELTLMLFYIKFYHGPFVNNMKLDTVTMSSIFSQQLSECLNRIMPSYVNRNEMLLWCTVLWFQCACQTWLYAASLVYILVFIMEISKVSFSKEIKIKHMFFEDITLFNNEHVIPNIIHRKGSLQWQVYGSGYY